MSNSELELGDLKFPPGTVFMTNYWALHRNNKVFPEPSQFKPERFLKDGVVSDLEWNSLSLLIGKHLDLFSFFLFF